MNLLFFFYITMVYPVLRCRGCSGLTVQEDYLVLFFVYLWETNSITKFMRYVVILISAVTLLSCSGNTTTETHTTKVNATDCCTELENAKNELRLKQMEIELLESKIKEMEVSMTKITSKQ